MQNQVKILFTNYANHLHNKSMSKNLQPLIEALRALLSKKESSTQESIVEELGKQGFEVNQSKISRLLRKIGAIKVTNVTGEIIYTLPREPAPPSLSTPLRDMIFDISANEFMIMIFVSPGCASAIARILDYHQPALEILGTLAGDDAVVVIPRSIKDIEALTQQVRNLLK